MKSGIEYIQIDEKGLHIREQGQDSVLDVDQIVICAGQEPLQDLYRDLQDLKLSIHLIGGANRAAELDAKEAIRQGSLLGARL